MLPAAGARDDRAGVAPAPFVEFSHALFVSSQTLAIWGMFGIGTPPLLARPNCASTESFTVLPATRLAGNRPFAAASAFWLAARVMYAPTRSLARLPTAWPAAKRVTMKPCTPRNGTDLTLIFGSWT